jgi:hypothetical protein
MEVVLRKNQDFDKMVVKNQHCKKVVHEQLALDLDHYVVDKDLLRFDHWNLYK